jgi:hypothetical protein
LRHRADAAHEPQAKQLALQTVKSHGPYDARST